MSLSSPFALANIRWFIAFRLGFHARFYYPVFTVLFLDLGLTLEQFFLLNAIWAVTIMIAEIPSGVLADLLGRRNLVILAGAGMVLEMTLLFAAAVFGVETVFLLLLANRVVSGLSEAMASGAEEALAYDSLQEAGLASHWPRVLEMQMRVQSAGFVVAMLVGGAVYDARFLSAILERTGVDIELTPETTLLFPILLCLLTSLLTLGAALCMRETTRDNTSGSADIRRAFVLVGDAGLSIIRSPWILLIILGSLVLDSTARTVITLASEYYRAIAIPEFAFGFIGASVGLLGLGIPVVARKLVENRSMTFNAAVVAGILMASLLGMALLIPYWGVIPVLGIGITLILVQFFVSHYLNQRVTDSSRRATILSVKNLANNFAYAGVGLLFMAVSRVLRDDDPLPSDMGETSAVFAKIIQFAPGYALVTLLFLAWAGRHFLQRGRRQDQSSGGE